MAKAQNVEQNAHDALCDLGDTIAKHYGIPATHVRYVHLTMHNGTHWTVKTMWQTYRDDKWVDEKWPYAW